MKIALVLAVCLAACNLQASTVIALFNGEVTSETIQRDVGDGAGFVSTTTGMFSFKRTGGTEVGIPNGTLYGFCIEPREFVSAGTTYTYDFTNLEMGATNIGGMGVAKADLLRELFGRFYPIIGAPIDAMHASAIQIATWEIVRENSGVLNVSTGNVEYQNPQDAAALTLAQTYLSALTGTGPRASGLYALTNVGAQDIIVQETPEPVEFATTGVALIALAMLRRRRSVARRGMPKVG
jgi:hypothetical protein